MSKTNFVSFADGGFWAYDVALAIFLKYLIDAGEMSPWAVTPWLKDQLESWRIAAGIQDIGPSLDRGWSEAERQTFVVLAEEACSELASRDSISAEEITSWPLGDDLRICTRGAKEVLTEPVVELGLAIIQLITEKLPEPPEGEIWLYGTETGRRTLPLRK